MLYEISKSAARFREQTDKNFAKTVTEFTVITRHAKESASPKPLNVVFIPMRAMPLGQIPVHHETAMAAQPRYLHCEAFVQPDRDGEMAQQIVSEFV